MRGPAPKPKLQRDDNVSDQKSIDALDAAALDAQLTLVDELGELQTALQNAENAIDELSDDAKAALGDALCTDMRVLSLALYRINKGVREKHQLSRSAYAVLERHVFDAWSSEGQQ